MNGKKFRYNLEQQLVSWDALSRLDDLRLERQLYPGVALALLYSTATSSTKLVIIIVINNNKHICIAP